MTDQDKPTDTRTQCGRHPNDCSVEKHAQEWKDEAVRLRVELAAAEQSREWAYGEMERAEREADSLRVDIVAIRRADGGQGWPPAAWQAIRAWEISCEKHLAELARLRRIIETVTAERDGYRERAHEWGCHACQQMARKVGAERDELRRTIEAVEALLGQPAFESGHPVKPYWLAADDVRAALAGEAAPPAEPAEGWLLAHEYVEPEHVGAECERVERITADGLGRVRCGQPRERHWSEPLRMDPGFRPDPQRAAPPPATHDSLLARAFIAQRENEEPPPATPTHPFEPAPVTDECIRWKSVPGDGSICGLPRSAHPQRADDTGSTDA